MSDELKGAIKSLEYAKERIAFGDLDNARGFVDDAIRRMKDACAEKPPWISVEERLPDANPKWSQNHMGERSDVIHVVSQDIASYQSRCRKSDDHFAAVECLYPPIRHGFYHHGLKQWRLIGSNNAERVTHWMPLPEGPK